MNGMDAHDAVFRALADPHRRTLLDALFGQDGQTLGELCAHLDMTRFGVMKHLGILEEAGLLVTRKHGREKLHYLNPVPIQEVYDRWVSKYAQPWTHTLVSLKHALETPTMADKHVHVYEVFIRATPQQVWNALTDGSLTERYYFGTRISPSLAAGQPYTYNYANGDMMISGEVLEIDPPRRLVTTFTPHFAGENPPTSQVTFEIEPKGPTCKLTLTHDMLETGLPVPSGIISGWAEILSGLKSLVETGEALVVEG
jgi:uncharacterized protein YndB with AHSA1/START domain/DNA-binding transcriptional ArsR family regulator